MRILKSAGMGVVALAALGAVSGVAQGDVFAPPWYVGGPLSVHAAWEFASPTQNWNDMLPDAFSVVGDGQHDLFTNFHTHAEVDSPDNWQWVPGDGDGGITPGPTGAPASIGFKLQNWVDDYDTKLMRIQITWSGIAPPSILEVIGYEGFIAPYEPHPGDLVGGEVVDAHHFYLDYIIHPNPNWDLVAIGLQPGTILDEVVIDTISIPGPGACAILALGSLVAATRRRR